MRTYSNRHDNRRPFSRKFKQALQLTLLLAVFLMMLALIALTLDSAWQMVYHHDLFESYTAGIAMMLLLGLFYVFRMLAQNIAHEVELETLREELRILKNRTDLPKREKASRMRDLNEQIVEHQKLHPDDKNPEFSFHRLASDILKLLKSLFDKYDRKR